MRTRKRADIAATTSWVTHAFSVPAKLLVKRVRAVAASPGTQVALQIREAETPDDIDIPLEYALAASPLDSEEDIFVVASAGSQPTGTIWVAVKADQACTVTVQLEYE
jgi:phage gp45-like